MRVLDLRLELQAVTPPVWRVLRVPADLRLDDLHHAIQAVMGWDDFHPHLFEVGAGEYGPRAEAFDEDERHDRHGSGLAGRDDATMTVAQALKQSPDGFTYVYDFDEDWRVRITGDGDAEPVRP